MMRKGIMGLLQSRHRRLWRLLRSGLATALLCILLCLAAHCQAENPLTTSSETTTGGAATSDKTAGLFEGAPGSQASCTPLEAHTGGPLQHTLGVFYCTRQSRTGRCTGTAAARDPAVPVEVVHEEQLQWPWTHRFCRLLL